MANTLTIELKNRKARKVLKSLEEINLIRVIYECQISWTPKKKKQAKDFLNAYHSARLNEAGKLKLKTAQSLLDEL